MGKTLKARRKFDEMDVMQSYIPIENHDDDPADKDTNLKNALEASLKLGEENMSKVIFNKLRNRKSAVIKAIKCYPPSPNIVSITRKILILGYE
jgi:hypothetical protein